jgi:limonene-1,2-epoxide hydrolase
MLPSETKSFWLLLAALAVALAIGFMGWFLHVTAKPSVPARSSPVQKHELTGEQAAADDIVSSSPSSSSVSAQRSSPKVSAPDLPPEARVALGSRPDLPVRATSSPNAGSAAEAAGASRKEPSRDPQVQAVEKFYRALSAADGKTAVAVIIPAKRGTGAFNEVNISKFYGSFERPLLLRSIRPINATHVEAKYSYRVSRTTCEGTAIVETEQVRQQTLIRSIRANC